MTPQLRLELDWAGERRFSGRSGNVQVMLDGKLQQGPSPTQSLGFAVAGCMAIDVVHILEKGRHGLKGLHAEMVVDRAAEDPKRFERITLHFTVTGDVGSDYVERALALSREKYCSVWHSLRQDIEFRTSYEIKPAG